MMDCLQVVLFLAVSCCMCQDFNTSRLGIPTLQGPTVAHVSSIVDFTCVVSEYPEGTDILYELYKDGNQLGMYTGLDGTDMMAVFPKLIQPTHEGYFRCKASVQNHSEIMPMYSSSHYLTVIEPVAGAHIVSDPSSDQLFEGTTMRLLCNITKGSHVSYEWFFNGIPVMSVTEGNTMTIPNTTVSDSGNYFCIASNEVSDSLHWSSNGSKIITIKEMVSVPSISFTVVKEGGGNYFAFIWCRSVRGTPPISFALINNSQIIREKTTDNLNETFIVPIDLDKHIGIFTCQARNGYTFQNSFSMPIEVVSVGGASVMTYEHYMDENFKVIMLKLHCQVERGTFPLYRWLSNNIPLTPRGLSHLIVPPNNSVLWLVPNQNMFGEFHCEAFNSFDKNITILSQRRFISEEASNQLPVMVVAVVFGCFSFISLVLMGCCSYGVYQWNHNKGMYILSAEMDERKPKCSAEDKDYIEIATLSEEVEEGEYEDNWPKLDEV